MKHALTSWFLLFAVALFFAGLALNSARHPCKGYAFGLMWACAGGAVVLGMVGGNGKPPRTGGESASRIGPNPTE